MTILEELNNPPKKFRPVPFWSWNDRLDLQEIKRQISEMEKAGLGGYFMHARGGLKTEYMSAQWFDAVKTGISEGEKRGMNPWLYDENGWPSGFADGAVNSLGINYQQKFLKMEKMIENEITTGENTIAVVRSEDSTDKEVFHFYYDVNPYYVDTLDGKVTDKFIKLCHKEYKKNLPADLWKSMPGFFTDEPTVTRTGFPWSFIFEDEYAERYCRELLPDLPSLFENRGDYKAIRYKFWKMVGDLFSTNFMKKIYDWCESEGIKLTGHLVDEDSFSSQMTSNGAVMPSYEYFHIPGMDWLGRIIYPSSTPLQLASVAAQLGKKQILSETFALTGWNVNFEELRWIAGWQMVHGVNLICQHLEGYSLRGIRKRDYPPSLFYQQPWWDKYHLFNDYLSRIGYLLSEGEINYSVLVLHGIQSAWLDETLSDKEGHFNSLDKITNFLGGTHINFHYGDQTIMEKYGRIEDKTLHIQNQSYQVVILPKISVISRPVYNQLLFFAEAGGTILGHSIIKDKGLLIDGEEDDAIELLLQKIEFFSDEKAIAENISSYIKPLPIVYEGSENIYDFQNQIQDIIYTKRDFKGKNKPFHAAYYMVNLNKESSFTADIYFQNENICLYDPLSGEYSQIDSTDSHGLLKITLNFSAMDQYVIITDYDSTINFTGYYVEESKKKEVIKLDGMGEIISLELNSLTLDKCNFYFDGQLEAENESVCVIADRVLARKKRTGLKMEFSLESDKKFSPDEELYLVLENPELFSIEINGKPISNGDCGFYRDISFRKISIAGKLNKGVNQIILERVIDPSKELFERIEKAWAAEAEKNKLTLDDEIESIYILGDFAVRTNGEFETLEREAVRYKGDFVLSEKPDGGDNRDLISSGLPFYNGRIKIKKTFIIEDLSAWDLVFDKLYGQIAEISINGNKIGDILWKPYSVKLDGLLKHGENQLELILTNSLRNLLGPHHLQEGESYAVGPFSFYKEDGIFARNWSGGFEPWNDDYCFVRTGIEGLRLEQR